MSQLVKRLPKTRSGKIMRRVLRKVVESDLDSLGDLSTLDDPAAVQEIIEGHSKISMKWWSQEQVLLKDVKVTPFYTACAFVFFYRKKKRFLTVKYFSINYIY